MGVVAPGEEEEEEEEEELRRSSDNDTDIYVCLGILSNSFVTAITCVNIMNLQNKVSCWY